MTAAERRPRTQTLPAHAKLSLLFWRLADGSGASTESREPEDVVRHALASMDALAGRRETPTAVALDFLVELEHDPYYAAPELWRGGEKDSRALVFSLGVVIFERLTGHHPFAPPNRRLRALTRNAPDLCSVPAALRATLTRAMSPFARDRFPDERALRAALARFAAGERTAPLVSSHGSSPPPAPGSTERLQLDASLARVRAATSSMPIPLAVDARRGSVLHGHNQHTAVVAERSKPRAAGRRMIAGAAAGLALVCAVTASWAVLAPVRPTLAPAPSSRQPLATPASSAPEADVVRSTSETPPGATVASPGVAAAAAITAAVGPTGGDLDADATEPTAPATAPAPSTEPTAPATAPAPSTEPTAPATAFHPESAAPEVAAAARACLEPGERRTDIGLSVRFGPTDGAIDRVYFAPNDPRPARVRACLSDALVGIAADVAPERLTFVTYAVQLAADGDHARGELR